jgi:hypothetical protein
MPNYVIQIGNSILGAGSGIFVVGESVAATPTYSVAAGTYNNNQDVAITSATPGASIYYTADGSTPTFPISGTTQLYTGALLLATATTLRALAVATGYMNSLVGSATYAFQVATPQILPGTGTYNAAQTVNLAVGTAGAAMYYTTNNTTPTTGSNPWTGTPITVSASETIQVIGVLTGYTNSLVSSATYVIAIPQAATPTAMPGGGSYTSTQTVALATTTGGASIYYTTDNTTPTFPVSGTTQHYMGALTVAATETIQAIAALAGFVNSNVLIAAYTISQPQVATPTATPAAGSVSAGTSVSLSCATAGASIYYNINAPATTGSTLYNPLTPIVVESTETIYAIGHLTGYTDSAQFSGLYQVGGATQVFNYTSFNSGDFGTTAGKINIINHTALVGDTLTLVNATDTHSTGQMWYVTQQNITSFTTNFTFSISNANVSGFTFEIQNSTNAVQAYSGDGGFGTPGIYAGADANAMGYGQYLVANPYGVATYNSIALYYTGCNQTYNDTATCPNGASYTGLLTEGGPFNPLLPSQDLLPYGVSVANGNEMAVNIVYDGTILTAVIQDMTTGAQARFTYPLNLPPLLVGNGVGAGLPTGTGSSNIAWIGFTASCGQHPPSTYGTATVYNWNYSTGYNARLATPTFSLASGEYSSGQSLTISGPADASIYYTTNGLLPTSSSTLYSGPITLTAGRPFNAVAIQAGFTDSYVASANYSIATANIINYPSGFAANDGVVICGVAALSGTSIHLTTTANSPYALGGTGGAMWYGTPVPITGNWTTTFEVQWSSANANGLGFIIQNQSNVGQSYKANTVLSGGPNCLMLADGSTYEGAASGAIHPTGVLVFFDLYSDANSVELYQDVPNAALNGGGSVATGLGFNGGTYTVTLAYTAATNNLAITMGSFSHNWTVNIPSVVNASAFNDSAYVGFAAYVGGLTANQYINNWTFSAS